MAAKFDPYRKWLGIPPSEQPPSHYRLLGIALFESDPDVISNAADRQMAHVRSFQTGPYGALSQRILNELSAARVCLLDPEKKAAYDARLRGEAAQRRSPGPSRRVAPPPAPAAEADPGAGIPLPFSTEPQFLADLEAGRSFPVEDVAAEFENPHRGAPVPESAGDEDLDALASHVARPSPAVRRRRSRGHGLEIALAAVAGAALLAALTWVWTHSSRSEAQLRTPEGPPKRAATGGPGNR